jgi:allantoicase
LAARGVVERIEVDTDHYKGNAPGSCALDVVDAPGAGTDHLTSDATSWSPLLDRTPLEANARHRFEAAANGRPATHVRLRIFPDGGVARLRLFGQVTA